MIIDPRTNAIRLTRAEFRCVQRANARNGFVVNEGDIRSFDDYQKAVYMGLSDDTAANMLEFIDTGSYPGMEENLARRAQEERDLAAADAVSPEVPVTDELAARRAATAEPSEE